MSGRDEVLARVRAALRTAERAAEARDPEHDPEPPAPARRPRASVDPADLLERFAERVADYRATVLRTDPVGVSTAVASALVDLDPGTVAAPPGLPADWRPGGALDGSALTTAELPAVEAVVTACRAAIAETGTIVLDHADDQGPRRLTLVPDRHVCVVRSGQLVDDVDDAFLVLRPAPPGGAPAPPLTFVSGPSATSDIELQRVEGVHGPRTLVVVLVDETGSPG
ncbi:LutC/YkgG family protein [Patulibacter minatonensis]|uniref:LutC/YkgG family protein n=1 Tax=Patulibacter minatonensis TaxID=298163 RepID=UPI000479ED74|nr:LUD domain-containing protein [Patulibacter minatonensis]